MSARNRFSCAPGKADRTIGGLLGFSPDASAENADHNCGPVGSNDHLQRNPILCRPEKHVSMGCKKCRLWRHGIIWEPQPFAGVCPEVLGHGFLWKLSLDPWRKQHSQILIKGNQPAVECRVVKPRKAKSVADVQSLGRMYSPRKDVRCNQEFTHGQLSDTAAPPEVVENRLAEILLPAPLFHTGDGLSRANGWVLLNAYSLLWRHLKITAFARIEQLAQRLLARRHRFVEIVVEFVPYRPVERACPRQPFDATQFQRRIEGCEITQFHRNAASSAAELSSERNDCRLSVVQLPERQFVIEVQGNEQLAAGPFLPGGHGGRIRLRAEPGQQLNTVTAK